MSWQMYPIASNAASFISSVDEGFVTFCVRMEMTSGHRLCGTSATAMDATHCAATLGLVVSVPSDAVTFRLTCSRTSSGRDNHRCWCSRSTSASFEVNVFFSCKPAAERAVGGLLTLTRTSDRDLMKSGCGRDRVSRKPDHRNAALTKLDWDACSRYCWACTEPSVREYRDVRTAMEEEVLTGRDSVGEDCDEVHSQTHRFVRNGRRGSGRSSSTCDCSLRRERRYRRRRQPRHLPHDDSIVAQLADVSIHPSL